MGANGNYFVTYTGGDFGANNTHVFGRRGRGRDRRPRWSDPGQGGLGLTAARPARRVPGTVLQPPGLICCRRREWDRSPARTGSREPVTWRPRVAEIQENEAMSLLESFANMFNHRAGAAVRRNARRSNRPQLEGLEDRQLLTLGLPFAAESSVGQIRPASHIRPTPCGQRHVGGRLGAHSRPATTTSAAAFTPPTGPRWGPRSS